MGTNIGPLGNCRKEGYSFTAPLDNSGSGVFSSNIGGLPVSVHSK